LMPLDVRRGSASLSKSPMPSAMSENLQKVGELSAQQQALLSLWLKKKAQARAQQIPQAPRGLRQRLSFAQERLWFVDQLEPDTATYNISGGVQLTGRLQVAALAQSLVELVRRHEILRTSFVQFNGEPSQQITAEAKLELPLVDLRGLPERPAERLLREEARRPFQLQQGPLLRVKLLRLGEEQYQLLFTMHHIVSDGWSMGVLVREVGALYEAYVNGEPSPLPELEIQYADFAVWQREWLTGTVLEDELSYWKQQLAHAPEVLELPADRPRPRLESFRGGHQVLELSESLSRSLRELSQAQGATLFMTLLAAFKTLLYRYSGQVDLLVGTPVANRNRVELEPLIGFFVNTLVLRTRVSGEISFRELLGRVRETVLAAQSHQELPFERLVQELAPERSLSHAPLFQVMMVLDNTQARRLELPQLELQALNAHSATAKLDLMLALNTNSQGELSAVIEYNTDLFDRSSMVRLAKHFCSVAQAVADNPDQPLALLPLLSMAERHRLLIESNDTRSECWTRCIPELFEYQAQRRPDAVALVFGEQQITYRELNARSNRLAHHLRRSGVGVETRVAICVERSIEMVAGLLAILKAGAVYVPLAADYPLERLRFMLANSQVAVLLTHNKTSARMLEIGFEQEPAVPHFNLDDQIIANTTPIDPATVLDSGEQLACIIYTSGSTGQPKGVAIPHRAIVRLVHGTDYVRFAEDEVFFQLSSLSFDAAAFEIWGALLNGARLAIMDAGQPSVEELAKSLKRRQVTTVFLTTALFHLVVQEKPAALASVRQVLAGGEVISPVHVRNHSLAADEAKTARESRLINGYGPTEVTTFASTEALTARTAIPANIAIGRPIANTTTYILDSMRQPVPTGVYGELYLGGLGLARGYYGQSSLTAEKFIPDIFSDTPGARLYRTGDIVRQLADGRIEYLGRRDHQIKLRGFRIELGEVEAALMRFKGVGQAAVLLREETPGDKRLVAYVVPETETPAFSVAELRSHSQKQLPDYMVPSAFVLLSELPFNPNGKVNRDALPVPPDSSTAIDAYVAPRTATEKILAGIWCEVLKLERVGVEDNFFDLGGHSLLAAQVMSRVRAACNVELPLRALFEAGTVAVLAQNVAEASQYEVASLVAVPRAGALPLSFAQERLWFLNQFEPQSAFYNIPVALRLRGPLNIAALESTLNEMVRRHEVLRTTFTECEGDARQLITPASLKRLPLVDLSELGAGQREARVQDAIKEDALCPFDLVTGPLLRQHLLRLRGAEHVVLLTMHHIVSDGWSMGVLVREVAALYEAYVNGEPSPLPELEIQYADFAVWQREWLTGTVLEAELSYWKQQLAHAPEVLDLPADRPRPRLESFRGGHQVLELSESLSRSLRELSQAQGATLFMTLLAAFKTLLYRYSGQVDLLVGTPVANRSRVELEPLIGFFVNTLVLRTRVSGEVSFRELLGRVRETVLAAQSHQELPFERLVQELAPERSLSHAPLFQVMMVLDNTPARRLELPQLELQAVGGNSATAKFDLTLALNTNSQGELSGVIEYNTDLFDQSRLARLAEHFRTLLQAVVADPDQALARLPLLTAAERHRLLVEWNDTASTDRVESCLHELVAAQAQLTPDAVALECEDAVLTYKELNARANQVARYLRRLGVAPDVLVGLCLEPSLELIVGVLGILKSGGAYVPLDPSYPAERLSFMMADSQAVLMVTQQQFAAGMQPPTVCLDSDWSLLAQEEMQDFASGVCADNLAYVIYTSGSTGKPKGAVIQHRSAVELVAWSREVFSETELQGVLAATSICFDLSIFELFVPLSRGGKAIVVADALRVPELAAKEGISLINTVPSVITELLRVGGLPQSVQTVNLAGEPLPVALVQQLHEQTPVKRVFDLYGPTEDTTYSTYALRHPSGPMTIGRPISNTRTYALDGNLEPLPSGVAGQLCIGGDGLARGYLRRPDLTAERFIPDPFSANGGRLYQTGDLTRHLSDGRLEYLGRLDQQVKVRGYRIELGEIEVVLTSHPAIAEAIVVAREAEGAKQLVAYQVASDGSQPTSKELREYLGQQLPQYMLPQAFVWLEELPRLPNGKVNRRQQLPAPEQEQRSEHGEQPRTQLEEILAGIWSEVLAVAQVGIEENFFELGGHSLLAVQVAARVRTALQIELPLRWVFESPTVRGLAARLQQVRQSETGVSIPAIIPALREGPLPLSFAQERLWFIDQLEPGSATYNIPGGVQLTGRLQMAALEQSLVEMVQRHEVFRTSFVEFDGRPVQEISALTTMDLPLVDLSGLSTTEQQAQAERLARAEARRPFQLQQAPLLRVSLLRLTDEQHQLLFTMHHIVSDGWSMSVLVKEVAALYEAYLNGKPSMLPQLQTQYGDYAVWQAAWPQEMVHEQLDYWRQQLAGAPEVLNLPADRPRPRLTSYSGGRQFLSLSANLNQAIARLSRQQNTTVFMTLLAAFKTLLYRYSGQVDLLVGTPVANRNRVELEPLIGFFVNTLVLRTRVSGEVNFRELLGRVRETVLAAQSHQELPFERLVQELAPERSLSHAPLFQVMMVLDNTPARRLELPQLELQAVGGSSATAKFDLTLALNTNSQGELSGVIEYNTDLFDQSRMARLAEHFRTLLQAVTAEPDQALARLPLLTAAERHRLLVEWNDTASTDRVECCLHELVAAQAQLTPDAVAIECEDAVLTYRELNGRANQVARYLRRLGVAPDVLVGLCLAPSLELIVGVLGILKSGGAYVPLDPSYPAERLSFMMADSQAPLMVTQQQFAAGLQPQTVCLDSDWSLLAQEETQDFASGVCADNLAYVIYTSGSTGKPKGAVIQHRSAVELVAWSREVFSAKELRGVLAATSICFDLSIFELFVPLSRGGKAIVVADALRVPELAAKEGISLINTVPSVITELLRVGGLPQSLQTVNLAGEALPVALVQQLHEQTPVKRVFDLYGPTEDTTYSTYALRQPSGPMTIGRPLANTRTYALDGNLEPLPSGVAGQLCIGGRGLARGYLRRPELTAERFIPDPFSANGGRLYQTGDLTRHLSDGRLEYLGRLDQQVKVRGYRIELGEIEAVLTAHPAIAEAIVVAREAEGAKQLVAYQVASDGSQPTSKELREYLGQQLPQYMLPQAFVWLEELPRLPNGKVNRRQLPVPEQCGERGDYELQPRTQLEEILAGIWSEVLAVAHVGIEENFFELGGHSLLAVQVAARVRTALHIELPLRWVFESPTVRGLAARLQEVRQSECGVSIPAITPALREGPLALSFAQERLWFIDQLEPGSPVYNISTAVTLEGSLQTAALEQSLAEMVRRHEVLRTCFIEIDGQPAQVTTATMSLPLRLVNLTHINAADITSKVIGQETAAAFDLTRCPLLRVRLAQLSEREHALVLTFHHIICDGWSMNVLVKEMASLYKAFSTGNPSPLTDLALQYGDYAAWQRRWLQGEVLDQELHYWKQQLSGVPEFLELPLDRPRPRVRKYSGAFASCHLSTDLSEALKALSRRSGSTLFMTLLAAFQLMLSRYSGQEDIVVGAPSAGRNLTELEGQIGFFINTLALRTDLSGNPTFLDLLARVRKVSLEAFAHQDAPFEKLLEELQVQRDLSRTPLLQVFFNMLNLPNQPVELPELRITPLGQEAGAKFDLTFYITDRRDGLLFTLVYDTDLFQPERMIEMLEQLECLLEQIVAEPGRLISEYSLVTPASRSVLPDATISLPEPVHEPITQTFFSVAEMHSERAAICGAGQSWNYFQLSQRAQAIASYLLKDGLKKGDVVAVSGQPSFSLIASLLGVMASGGVLLTLDPNLPAERRKMLLREVAARRLLLAEDPNAEDWIPQGVTVIDVRQVPDTVSQTFPPVDPEDPAYIFFTSGTTGVPKAVLGCHKGLAHFLNWQRDTFKIGPNDRCAQLTALSFDVVMRDIFLPLTSGASLHLPATEAILAWLEQERITVIHTVPSLVQSWLRDVPTGVGLSALRYAFLAGEPLTDSLAHRWRAQFPESGSIVNLYGPTETTLAKCFYVLPEQLSFGVQPVGRPLPETQALVLNRGGGLCGVGERGEISIRTPFRTLGYLNQTGENQKRFVQNPLIAGREDVIYKTGDLGRYRLDGTVEVLGRTDDQIKVRGVRVEPGEVTAVLLRHPGVQSATVVGFKDAEGNVTLAAYVIAAAGDQIIAGLRAFLSTQLPTAMVPSSFTFLDELPLTANGKLDRRRLPAPEMTQAEPAAPRSWTEEVLAGIWAEVLQRDQIGVHDDFFELGGHSLLATQVISRVRQAFHIELPLRRLFECPTVALLAETIAAGNRACVVPTIEPVSREGSLPLSFAQERLWFLHQLQPDSFAYNMAARIDLTGALNVVALDQGVSEVIRRHEILRTTFPTFHGQPIQVVGPPPRSILTIADLSGLSEAEQQARANSLSREQEQKPFELGRSPVLRGILVRLDQDAHVLLLGIHHIAADAWSTSVFVQEVGSLYGSFLSGEQSQLPELAIQYVDFAAWQRSWLRGEVLETQLAHWRKQLKNSPPMLELPTDRPRPPVQTFRGETATLSVPEELTSRLVTLSRRTGATLFMTVMAVFKTLLYRYSGCEDNVVGTGIAERKSVELERMIGLFVNQLAIRTQFSGEQPFVLLLENVRDTSLAAYAHQDLPFEKLVAELQPERSLSRTPVFQVMLLMQTAPASGTSLADVNARLQNRSGGGAKFDLTMHTIPARGGLRIVLEYNTILFDAGRVSRMLGHFHSLLEAVATQPEQRLCDLPLLTAAERSQLLVEWNDTDTQQNLDVSIDELIEAQSERTPEAIAVEFAGAKLSYGELNRRANQVAHFLRGMNVGPEVMVGLCVDRSLEMVVAMLGIMKAGGAYVPLDPAYPSERIAFMLDDTQTPILLTQQRVAVEKELQKRDASVICLDRDWSRIASEPHNNVSNGYRADRLAYVIYTSGSTGRPKGVAIQQRSAVALLAWARTIFSAEEFRGVLASTSICFDLSVFELFAPLSSGGRVIIVADALRLPGLESTEAISLLNTVPSAVTELLRSNGLPKSIQTVNLAGEPLSTSLVKQLYEFGSIKRVFDLYGPSEDTTYSTFALRSHIGQATIGRPISNTRAYALDRNRQPVPVGVPGELYLGGEGLARGYLNRPELTATKFISNPFSNIASGRLYKTGDLVRYMPDGRIEYLGRTDHQIKLRGFRIELGEVEAVLRKHPQVRENIVLVREDEPGDRRLVAYLVTTDGADISNSDLRSFLHIKLPDYMIPSAFIRLDALPLTSNGKVDRGALPRPDDVSAKPRHDYVAPRAEFERSLANIWQQVLRVAMVGVEDNFFDLGGHSLLLVRLIQEIQNSLGLEVSLMEVFEHPTVASLARHLSSKAVEEKVIATSESASGEAEARRRRRMKRQKASAQTSSGTN
jgi:amino acid adenylation domain-containing protein